MEEGTALVLALQLLALAAIAAALLLYLLCRLRPPAPSAVCGGAPRGSVLVPHADSALGLQIALWLAHRGFRVLAGLKEGPQGQGPAPAACRAWLKRAKGEGEGTDSEQKGWLQALRLDATKEDELHEAVGAVKGHLPADEDGLWAVVHVGCEGGGGGGGGGGGCRGRLETQQSALWEKMLRDNVVGALRAARALLPLLRAHTGRLVLLGKGVEGAGGGGVAWCAARAAVEGAAAALRAEVAPVDVITLRPHPSLPHHKLYAPPTWRSSGGGGCGGGDVEVGGGRGRGMGSSGGGEGWQVDGVECEVLGRSTLMAIEGALLCASPKHAYTLLPPLRQAQQRSASSSCTSAAAAAFTASFRRTFLSSSNNK